MSKLFNDETGQDYSAKATRSTLGTKSKPNPFNESWKGPIRGLCLPLAVWTRLGREGITTIDQLQAVAHQLEKLDGIGPKAAWIIREELVRVTVPRR